MSASIRGHQGVIKIFKAGAQTGLVHISSVDVNQESSFSRSFYVGAQYGEGDQAIEGWSGSMELEVKDASVDEFIDALVTNNLNGIGVEEITVLLTENYPNGQTKSYVYFDCQFKMSKKAGGLKEKMTKRLEFQAAGRLPL
jgi:hypothetical protein